MVNTLLWWLLAAVIFALVLSGAGKADYDRCMDAGKRIGAKAVVVGNRCMIEGYGRLY